MTIRAHTEKNQVENGETRSISVGEFLDEFLRVRIRKLLEVIKERFFDRMYLVLGDGDL